MKLYHFTDGTGLRGIIEHDMLRGDTTHTMPNGLEAHGTSLTRDRNLDLDKTYAIGGPKPFRLTLDADALRHRHRIIPVRDKYLQNKHKAAQRYSHVMSQKIGYQTCTDSNESEEFLLGSVKNILPYITQLAIRDWEIADTDYNNSPAFWDLMEGSFGHINETVYRERPLHVPSCIPIVFLSPDMLHPSQEVVADSDRLPSPPDLDEAPANIRLLVR